MTTDLIAPVEQPVPTKISSKKVKTNKKSIIRYRVMIFFRFILALFGGYYFAAIAAMLMGQFFHTEPLKANAVMSATMLAFILHCGVFIWVFMVSSTLKAWLGVILPSVLMTVVYWLIKG
ncbi:DUF3649 domain-containing protein [Acinetobacter corruptisaponis]|uniref:DUF3649 domain-containing protein n=1 Tax=Acinetobacter corruptisaponis TaxID=3045147 RepID=A0ABY8S3L9_9GAMM|nr:DUF3649 domain-containing protein [Acinetobacter sp. KCTC 92772]WHP05986.1 DUF3649 domain-containing protein [Acinetobacter sp. KCTC 92772]